MSRDQLKSEVITAHCECQSNRELNLSKLDYPNIYIPDRGFAISLSIKDEKDDAVQKIKKDVEEYNSYIEYLFSIKNFWEHFKSNGYCISHEECESLFGKEDANKIFALKRYKFEPELMINEGWLLHKAAKWRYFIDVDGYRIKFETEGNDDGYPKEVKRGRRKDYIFWNWWSDERDFCFYLIEMLDRKAMITYAKDDEEEVKSYAAFDCYNETRECLEGPDPNLMKIFKLLQDMGYLRVFYIKTDIENPVWKLRTSPGGRIGMMLLDSKFEKNPLLMEKIKLLLNCSEEDIEDYMLTDGTGHQYQSKTRGAYGGNSKLKIYGKLDCPSANRYVRDGKYIQHRVFFNDEETAIKAGYRPCAKCMPNEYNKWKQGEFDLKK